jgi:hypothetical protein
VRGFLFPGYSLRLRKLEQKAGANGRVTNRCRPPFRVYKGPGENHSKLHPNSPQNSKLEGKAIFPFLKRLARATGATRNARPVALTPCRSRRHLWQARRASLRLRHDDRVKKGAPPYLNLYPSPPPLSLSCYRDRERGCRGKDPSRRRKWAPSPPTDQGFEGWPLGRVSTAAPEHSDFKPITDQGFVGWPLGRVRQSPQSTQSEG